MFANIMKVVGKAKSAASEAAAAGKCKIRWENCGKLSLKNEPVNNRNKMAVAVVVVVAGLSPVGSASLPLCN